MLGADSGIVETCGDRINGRDLAVLVLAEIRLHAVEDTELAGVQCSSCLEGIDAPSRSLAADELDAFIFYVVIEGSDRIRTAAAASENIIGKPSLFFQYLRSGLS